MATIVTAINLMVRLFKFLLIVFASFCSAAEYCYFTPPQGWDMTDPKALPFHTKVCFIGKTSKPLRPSVNLSVEETSASLKTYLEAVKNNNKADPNRTWRDLGKFMTPLGEGRLTEIEVKTEVGMVRQVQLIVLKNKTAYILTTAALKEEFSKHYQTFEKVFHSLNITQNFPATLSQESQRIALQELIDKIEDDFEKAYHQMALRKKLADSLTRHLFARLSLAPLSKESALLDPEDVLNCASFQQETWLPMQEKIINDFTEKGPYWQSLLLSDILTKLLTKASYE